MACREIYRCAACGHVSRSVEELLAHQSECEAAAALMAEDEDAVEVEYEEGE